MEVGVASQISVPRIEVGAESSLNNQVVTTSFFTNRWIATSLFNDRQRITMLFSSEVVAEQANWSLLAGWADRESLITTCSTESLAS